MPKIEITGAKGLVQKAGSGTVSGAKLRVETDIGSGTAKQFSELDSGGYFVLGGASAGVPTNVKLPKPAGNLKGWYIDLVATGTLGNHVDVIKGGDTTVLVNGIDQTADGAAAAHITTTQDSNTTVRFTSSHTGTRPVRVLCLSDNGSTITFLVQGTADN